MGHQMKIHAHKRPDGRVKSWEVGRRSVRGKRKPGKFVPTWEEAVELRREMEAAERDLAVALDAAADDRAAKKVPAR